VLLAVVKAEGLKCEKKVLDDKQLSLEDLADHILMASYEKGIDLFSMDELGIQVEKECAGMFKNYPGARIRLKAIGGGGGKGQRILGAALLMKSIRPRPTSRRRRLMRRGWCARCSSRSRPTVSATTRTSLSN